MGKTKEIVKKDKEGNIVDSFSNSWAAVEDSGLSQDNLYKTIKNHREINGFYYEYSGRYTNEKPVYENGFKCPYCEEILKNYNGLAKHIMHSHKEVSKEQLLTDYYYGGERPKCKCGCGEYTKIIYDKKNHNQIKFADFCQGHQSRIHNNWGHNEKAKVNSAETRRKQYASGERKQWNKGKSWDETYTEEQQEKLMLVFKDEKRRNKISETLKNVPKSEEHKAKLREVQGSPEMREIYRKNLLKRMREGSFSLTSKLERDFIDEFIKPLKLDYIPQHYIKDIHQYCDVYIPSKNTIVEVDGSHWHCDPRLFPDGPKFDYQKKKVKLDEQKNQYCKDHNIKILRFWELDIKESPEDIVEILQEKLLKN